MTPPLPPHAYLFTDGSSGPHEDTGAWAAIAVAGTNRKLLFGVQSPTSISRCELIPIIEGLRWIKSNWVGHVGFRVVAYSDSEYTVKTLAGLYGRHKNEELWRALDEAQRGMVVQYCWRERNSLPYMAWCDAICGALRGQTKRYVKENFPDPKQPELVLPDFEIPVELPVLPDDIPYDYPNERTT